MAKRVPPPHRFMSMTDYTMGASMGALGRAVTYEAYGLLHNRR